MKKMMVAALCLLSIIMLPAQGIYQLWGTTPLGGDDDLGIIFSTDAAANNYNIRHQFHFFDSTGAAPVNSLTEYNGKFYGMTVSGGDHGGGVIFEWDPVTNLEIKKFSFGSRSVDRENGFNPYGNLTLYEGKFYGTAYEGGENFEGVIFEWDPATNIYTKKIDLVRGLSNLPGPSGPKGSLVMMGGKFYGMTENGGLDGRGTIFEWDPATNILTKKIDLNLEGGIHPLGDLTLFDGKFYGMTYVGGNDNRGVIFEWDPAANVYTKKIDFDNFPNGSYPTGNLTLYSGKFYGTTSAGGAASGVIFEWDPVTNLYTKKIDLTGTAGAHGNLTMVAGKFYGMQMGGGTDNLGIIFEWDPVTNAYTQKVDFNGSNGSKPLGSLALKDGRLFGMTSAGGSNGYGVFFEWDPVTNNYTTKINLNSGNPGGNTPACSLTYFAGKLYGTTYGGGVDKVDAVENKGVIFEFDPLTNVFSKKIDLSTAIGSHPFGKLAEYDGKLYGMTYNGGSKDYGVIFEWDPVTNVYTKKIELGVFNTGLCKGSLVLNGGKFYGISTKGGINDMGMIFEWDPATNAFTKKIDFDGVNASGTSDGSLSFRGAKFYGVGSGGSLGNGLIFEWDPATNVYTKKVEFDGNNGSSPHDRLTVKGEKFYGVTFNGSPVNSPDQGVGDAGAIFEWDPATNVITSKIQLIGSDPRPAFYGSLTLSGDKFYTLSNFAGIRGRGEIIEWDPATNVFIEKRGFEAAPDGAYPNTGNDLALVPVPVARGAGGSCMSFPSVTIDNSNNNKWVAITDDQGNAVAEIKANGNNLGIINTSMYVHNGAVRQDGMKRLYLDRNITITPQSQPATPVDIRLYIRGSEYQALKDAVNSIGESSGISSIDDLGIYKMENCSCASAVDVIANPVPDSVASWQDDYVLSGSINSFSTFYFANKTLVVLPLTLTEFNGRLVNNNGLLNWKISNELNTAQFEVERSIDGRNYSRVGTVRSANTAGIHDYSFTDPKIASLGARVIYYRLKQTDLNGRFTYSRIIALSIDNDNIVLFYPNPVKDNASLTITINQAQQLKARIIDAAGKTVSQLQWKLSAGSTSLSVDVSRLAKGMYYLELKGTTINERKLFSKQ